MAVLAAPSTGALSPQVGAQIVAVSSGNNMRAVPYPAHIIASPVIYSAPAPPAVRATAVPLRPVE